MPAGRALRGRRRSSWALATTLVVLVVATGLAVHLLVTGLQARAALLRAHTEAATLPQRLVPGDTEDLTQRLSALRADTARARALTSDPVWRVAGAVPLLGRTPRTVTGLAQGSDELAATALPLAAALARLTGPRESVRPPAAMDLEDVAATAQALDTTARRAEAVRASVAALPARLVLAPVARARADLLHALDAELVPALHSASSVAQVAPAMLGADGPRRYFLALQNTAEARGTGGLPGAYAVLVLDRGRLRLERVGSDRDLHNPSGVPPRSSPEHTARYGHYATGSAWMNANLGPHFPDAGRIWSKLWERQAGQRVDGVIALDPAVLDHLLAATGPVTLPDGTELAPGDAVPVTLEHAYARYQDQTARKTFIVGLVPTVLQHALSAPEPAPLARAALASVAARRVHVWSRHPPEQHALERSPLGGALPRTIRPYLRVVVHNAFGNKLDYYLERHVDYWLGGCTGDTRPSRITVRLANRAPVGLGDYVTGRVENARRKAALPYAHHRVLVSVVVTSGAQLRGAVLDGRATTVRSSKERGHPVVDLYVDLPRGQARTLVLDLVEPVRAEAPLLEHQPLVRAQTGAVSAAPCR